MGIKFKSIRLEVVMFNITIVFISLITMGAVQYFSEIRLLENHIVDKATVSLQPILSVAAKSVDGGNIMTLKNQSANDLYSSNSDLLYLKISGISAGSPKTDFSDAIPPSPIEWAYSKESVDTKETINNSKSFERDMKDGSFLDNDHYLFYIKKDLPITNGGTVIAVYSAKVLDGAWLRVFGKVFFVLILIMISAAVLSMIVGNQITKPIRAVTDQITDISRTLNLGTTVKVAVRNEIETLVEHFNELILKVRDLLKETKTNSALVSESTSLTTANLEKLVELVITQNHQMSGIASAIEESSATVQEISENGNRAAISTGEVKNKVNEGAARVDETIEEINLISKEVHDTAISIGELGTNSEQIGNIITVINDIADQTNLLALNAAIEAARAGEHGRGFAVVADEVRKLSERTTKSTKEISQMISTIQNNIKSATAAMQSAKTNVGRGVDKAHNAGKSLEEIIERVNGISDMITQIATATEEQTATVVEISRNTQSVFESTGTVKNEMLNIIGSNKEVATKSDMLKNSVSKFKFEA